MKSLLMKSIFSFWLIFMSVNSFCQNESSLLENDSTPADTIVALTNFIGGTLKEGPNIDSKEILEIPPGSEIKILDYVNYPFLKIIYSETIGYFSIAFVEKEGKVKEINDKYSKPQTGSPSINSNNSGSYNPSDLTNTNSLDCSTVQCSSYTQKGNRCKNRTTNCSGKCHTHN